MSKFSTLGVGAKIIAAFSGLIVLIACSNAISLYSLHHLQSDLLKLTNIADHTPLVRQMLNDASRTLADDQKNIYIFAPLLLLTGFGLAFAVTRHLRSPIQQISTIIQDLSDGKTRTVIPNTTRQDELGVVLHSCQGLQQKVAASYRLKHMVDNMPTSVLVIGTDSEGRIHYANNAAMESLQKETLLNKPLRDLFGDAWETLADKVNDRKALPFQTQIRFGNDTLKVEASAILESDDSHQATMLSWTVTTAYSNLVSNFEASVAGAVQKLAQAVEETRSASTALSEQSNQMVSRSGLVAGASQTTSSNVQSVAAATEEMTGSIAEIGRQVQQSTNVVATANQQAYQASRTMDQLSQSAREIGEVVDLIVDIAEQTSLLALNATIEAAAAGDAGRGFAVVAHEVKNLASETAKATEIISGKIADVQAVTQNAVMSIENITKVINELQEIAATISAAIEEQTAATKEISASIAQASGATINVSSAIGEISALSSGNGEMAGQVLHCAHMMSEETAHLKEAVNSFIQQARVSSS
jgi:methyl-accepting chemotaxis protein